MGLGGHKMCKIFLMCKWTRNCLLSAEPSNCCSWPLLNVALFLLRLLLSGRGMGSGCSLGLPFS